MSPLAPLAVATACGKPHHRLVSSHGLLADPVELIVLDLATVREADLKDFQAHLRFDIPVGRRLDGLVTWFECEFGDAGWLLSTSPSDPATHWRQTAFYLRQPFEAGCRSLAVEGTVRAETHAEYSRGYRVALDLVVDGQHVAEVFELR